jgi:hypothetical protein
MTTCVLFNDKDEFVNLIVAEPSDWVPEGWRLEEVKRGFLWHEGKIVKATTVFGIKEVDPEVI